MYSVLLRTVHLLRHYFLGKENWNKYRLAALSLRPARTIVLYHLRGIMLLQHLAVCIAFASNYVLSAPGKVQKSARNGNRQSGEGLTKSTQ